jgi:polyhydroxyalkanoate synthesis regulator phasin
LDTARELLRSKHKIEPIFDDDDLFRALKEQQKKVRDLEEMIEKLQTQQNGTPTNSQSTS